jgi:hypothetical protein
MKDRPKQRPKNNNKSQGCAPDDPLCGIKLD